MKKWLYVALLMGCFSLSYFFWVDATVPNKSPIEAVVDPHPLYPKTNRLGVDLSAHTWWGSNQYYTNVLMNPGFEATVSRVLVTVSESNKTSFSDEEGWGYPDGDWEGADYEVLSGPSSGMKGKIIASKKVGKGGLPQYMTEHEAPSLNYHDVVSLTKIVNPPSVNCWWIREGDEDQVVVDPAVYRPESPGRQSVRFSPKETAVLNAYLDTMTDRAGILLPVKGPWRLSFWLKADNDQGKFDVSFYRLSDMPVYLKETITPTTEWKEYTFDFTGAEEEIPGSLKLSLDATGKGIQFWLDDIFLGPVQAMKGFPFRQEVVSLLHQLRPSYIRENQGQYGDQFPNRIAEPFARRPTLYRVQWPGPGEPYFCYSLPELFQLCDVVGALPWIIMPCGFGEKELEGFANFLLENASKRRFSEVILEFGNENWNELFRPSQIPYPDACRPVVERAFQTISAIVKDEVNLKKMVSAQLDSPYTAIYAEGVPSADALGIAAYLYDEQNSSNTMEETLKGLFSDHDVANMDAFVLKGKEFKKDLAIYEMNLGTTGGDATDQERRKIVAGAVSGAALAKQVLRCAYRNMTPQSMYCFAGFDDRTSKDGKVPLFGIVRDVGPTKRFRPTGLAMKMLNRALGGALHPVKVSNQAVCTVAALSTLTQWSAIVISESEFIEEVAITFPDDGKSLPKASLVLEAKTPFSTNEEQEKVKIVERPHLVEGRTVTVTVPPLGLVVM